MTSCGGAGSAPFRWSAALDQAPGKGHDRWLVEGHFAAVADGATPLAEDWPDPGEFADFALRALAAGKDAASAREQWARAVAAAVRRYGEGGYTRSCGVAAARFRQGRLEVVSVGDCGALVLLRDQTVQVQLDTRLTDLDDGVRGRGDESELLLANRKRLNTQEGYWVFSPAPALVDHVAPLEYAAEQVEAVLLFSDGLARLVEPLRAYDWHGLLTRARAQGPAALLAELRRREADAPRSGGSLLGRPDDAVAVLLQV